MSQRTQSLTSRRYGMYMGTRNFGRYLYTVETMPLSVADRSGAGRKKVCTVRYDNANGRGLVGRRKMAVYGVGYSTSKFHCAVRVPVFSKMLQFI